MSYETELRNNSKVLIEEFMVPATKACKYSASGPGDPAYVSTGRFFLLYENQEVDEQGNLLTGMNSRRRIRQYAHEGGGYALDALGETSGDPIGFVSRKFDVDRLPFMQHRSSAYPASVRYDTLGELIEVLPGNPDRAAYDINSFPGKSPCYVPRLPCFHVQTSDKKLVLMSDDLIELPADAAIDVPMGDGNVLEFKTSEPDLFFSGFTVSEDRGGQTRTLVEWTPSSWGPLDSPFSFVHWGNLSRILLVDNNRNQGNQAVEYSFRITMRRGVDEWVIDPKIKNLSRVSLVD